jgi:hypothetical protein
VIRSALEEGTANFADIELRMKAIDNCCVVGSACMPGSNRNDQEGEQTQLIMLDQKRVLFKSRVLRTPKKKCKAFFPRRSLLS